MSFVPGICTQCGAVLSVDVEKKSFCPYCHKFREDVYGDFIIAAGILYKYTGKSDDIVVPPDVFEIKTDAFPRSVRSVTLPDGLKAIEGGLFLNCPELIRVDIADNVTTIGERAFAGCTSLRNIRLPQFLEKIQAETFYGCISLTSIIIPDTVTEIGAGAFSNCKSLTNITIPKHVTEIGKGAFSNCSNLTSMTLKMLSF